MQVNYFPIEGFYNLEDFDESKLMVMTILGRTKTA